MYSTCIFCHSDLAKNEAIEHFPVGRRLAFDAARGRLWVVCRKCERWNLTPLEERWEAIEECERLFSSTKLRVSTDNIGLAKLREGLELVRIGSPQRPEMAAWRYGDQFGRRRRRHLVYTGAAVVVVGGLAIAGPATGILAGGSWGLWNLVNSANNLYQHKRVRARVVIGESATPVAIRLKQLNRVSIVRADDSWALGIPVDDSIAIVTGAEAMRAAAKLLPAINASGAKREEVDAAVNLIGSASEPLQLFESVAGGGTTTMTARRRKYTAVAGGHAIANLSKATRLALEMATHEESERRALEGELALLEAEWRQAEEIAAIADDMFVSDETRDRITTFKESK